MPDDECNISLALAKSFLLTTIHLLGRSIYGLTADTNCIAGFSITFHGSRSIGQEP